MWSKNGLHNGTIEATSIEGCRLIKVNNPKGKCLIYHNMELALESMESQRAVMYDPSKAYLFLQYTDGKGNKNGTVYNERQEPGDQFFWDFRVPDAASYYISSVLATTNNPNVDGTFTDDVTGLPAEHGAAPGNMKLSAAEVAAIQVATQDANGVLIAKAIAQGKYVWAAFGDQDGVGSGPTQATCADWMRQRCTADWQLRATTQHIDAGNVNQSIAAFLVVRPPIAFLGNGWESDQRSWRSEFLWNVGAPAPAGSVCSEGPANVFSRTWTYGTVSLDVGGAPALAARARARLRPRSPRAHARLRRRPLPRAVHHVHRQDPDGLRGVGEGRRRSTADRLAQSEPSSSYLIRPAPFPARPLALPTLSTRHGSRSPSRCPMR